MVTHPSIVTTLNKKGTLRKISSICRRYSGIIYIIYSAFLKLTDNIAETFESKHQEYPPFVFSGINISVKDSGSFPEQTQYASDIDLPPKGCYFESFRTMRHKLACVINKKPEILAEVNILSQISAKMFKRR